MKFKQTKPGDVGIFGDPVEHSLSPAMHNAAFETWKNVWKGSHEPVPFYHKFHVTAGQLEAAMALVKKYKLLGLNITIPHKIAALQLMDWVDPFAQHVGAINTVVLEGGQLKGFNTDGYGFRLSLEADLGMDLEGKNVLLLGAGGAGRVIAYQLQQEKIGRIDWWNRDAQKLEDFLNAKGHGLPNVKQVKVAEELGDLASSADLVVNATSIGLQDGDGLPAPHLRFRRGQCIFDVIYNRTTDFMREGKKAGAFVAGGLGMLVYQGVQSFRLWTGKPAPVEVMRLALSNSLKKV